jgi:hypothetical protein
MHCEKNLCENIVKTLLSMTDSPGSRVDAQELGIREETWLQAPRRRNDDFHMPHAPYVLSAEERAEFIGILSNIRTPTNYVGAIQKRFKDGKLQYMKTHDYHVLMQQVRHTKVGALETVVFFPMRTTSCKCHNRENLQFRGRIVTLPCWYISIAFFVFCKEAAVST